MLHSEVFKIRFIMNQYEILAKKYLIKEYIYAMIKRYLKSKKKKVKDDKRGLQRT